MGHEIGIMLSTRPDHSPLGWFNFLALGLTVGHSEFSQLGWTMAHEIAGTLAILSQTVAHNVRYTSQHSVGPWVMK
jgi:hypothetical protein